MCIGSKPKTQAPPPPVKVEEAKTDEHIDARKDVRRRLKSAANSRSTLLGGDPGGKKTLLGQ